MNMSELTEWFLYGISAGILCRILVWIAKGQMGLISTIIFLIITTLLGAVSTILFAVGIGLFIGAFLDKQPGKFDNYF